MSEFIQNGWDTEKFTKGLTPKVKSRYIEGEVEVTVYEPGPMPTAGYWLKQGDEVAEVIDNATIHTGISDDE